MQTLPDAFHIPAQSHGIVLEHRNRRPNLLTNERQPSPSVLY